MEKALTGSLFLSLIGGASRSRPLSSFLLFVVFLYSFYSSYFMIRPQVGQRMRGVHLPDYLASQQQSLETREQVPQRQK